MTLKPGTRILDIAEAPDRKTLSYLRREFGQDILRKPPWQVLSRNKKLSLREVVTLTRYHFHEAYGRERPRVRTTMRVGPRRIMHMDRLGNLRKVLVRYGFDGFGDPTTLCVILLFREECQETSSSCSGVSGSDLAARMTRCASPSVKPK